MDFANSRRKGTRTRKPAETALGWGVTGKTQPPSVAIVGRPNVGKSALFNRLIGRQMAIVHNQPGVTRDRVAGLCSRGSQPFTVWDTGGIGGRGESELIADVKNAVEDAVRESSILLFMVDAQQGLSPIDQELARLLRKSRKPILLVVNKIDDPKHEDLDSDFASLGFGSGLSISAAHGRGMSQLLEEIETLLPANSTEEEPSEVSAVGPVTVAVVGRPNVGKSSFINAITQTKRAIVSELPGTTRDAIDIVYQRNGDEFVFIDTAGMRKRGSHSSSVEVFSVMRSERSIRRAKLCILMVDVTSGVTMQDKKIAGLIQEAGKAAIVILNKFDLVKPKRGVSNAIQQVVEEARQQLFFLDYAPVLVTSAVTGEHVEKLFRLIKKLQRDARARIGTGALNRHLRAAFAANPPPMVSGHRLKLFYATQAGDANEGRGIEPAKFVLFVNDPRLLSDTYRRYLERQIREIEPYAGVPIFLNCRSRSETAEL
ncbi:MAG: GTPase [Verrucomicrobiota bacterium]